MRKIVSFLIVFVASMAGVWAQSADVPEPTPKPNRLQWGIAFEAMRFDEEWFPGGETHLLIPCNETFSLGAVGGLSYWGWDAGVMAGWRLKNNFRIMTGLGVTYGFYTPTIRLILRAPGPFYLSGKIGLNVDLFEGGLVDMNDTFQIPFFCLGFGWTILGGKNPGPTKFYLKNSWE